MGRYDFNKYAPAGQTGAGERDRNKLNPPHANTRPAIGQAKRRSGEIVPVEVAIPKIMELTRRHKVEEAKELASQTPSQRKQMEKARARQDEIDEARAQRRAKRLAIDPPTPIAAPKSIAYPKPIGLGQDPVEKVSAVNEPKKIPTVQGWKAMIASMKQEPHIIEDLLPAEPGTYGIIAGRTGIGKTNLILHLGHCLATGSPFFGVRCEKVKVAILAFEGDPHNLDDRLGKIGANFPPTGNRLRFEILPIQNPDKMLVDVVTKLKSTPGIQVAILDPIKYLVPGDYLKPKEVAMFIQGFLEVLNSLKMSAITTLPIRKPQDSKGLIRPADIYSIKGATEWVDSATFGLLVEKRAYSKSSDEITMSFAKHRIASRELEDEHLIFDRETCTYQKIIMADGTKNLVTGE